ncbi:hypothetical protein CXF82_09285 [Shewanella sp. GutDb-MelDb]|nr:hypothetical protein CXF82_09285 [Shewanella sp. GutDb-MelDb]PKG74782.1 hypothetical protein CXF86_10835 [Shewanella sp. GutCb]
MSKILQQSIEIKVSKIIPLTLSLSQPKLMLQLLHWVTEVNKAIPIKPVRIQQLLNSQINKRVLEEKA